MSRGLRTETTMLEKFEIPELQPDLVQRVQVDGHEVAAYSYGSGDEVLLCLNGGPGLPCDYLRDAHAWLKDRGLRIVAFDQLGTGKADRPEDPALWTIARYVEEVETVRKALGLGRVHLLGHSWGGWLSIEYSIHYPQAVKTLILENTVADIPHLSQELGRLRAALGSETVAMMQRHEAKGTTDHPEYQAAVTLLNYRHVCRLEEWPAPVKRSLDDWNMGPYPNHAGTERVPLHRQPARLEPTKGNGRVPHAYPHHYRPARRTHPRLRPVHETGRAPCGSACIPQ